MPTPVPMIEHHVEPPTVHDHRGPVPVVHPPPTAPVPQPRPPIHPIVPVHPVAPTPVHPGVPIHPIVPVHPVIPPVHYEPPRAHYEHHDYVFVENYGWWPHWFPYWEPAWYAYWWQLYEYYGGDENREYAEWARDQVLRGYAPQMGWL
jgi:hypothetical protein